MFEAGLLKDKVILVTGGGTGLGRAMATRFLTLGGKLVIAGRRAGVLEQAAAEMAAETSGEGFTQAVDVRDPEAVARMISEAEKHYGSVDVLVNNAAGNFVSPT
ncbi:MAG: SDR family NAD(P)-dependent oxidoreductase, partial [Deinococcota bacterium]|nr:SDR family NAD(P)-dependent oxidoreductase [Deinococcota bacterium]